MDPTEQAPPSRLRTILRRLLLGLAAATALATGTVVGIVVWLETGDTRAPQHRVHDVTELVQIDVERVVAPTSAEEVAALLARHEGPISIGGGRFSMGGQIATDDTLFLDLRAATGPPVTGLPAAA